MRDDRDDDEPPPFPVSVGVAGVIWIVLGALFTFGSCVSYFLLPVLLVKQGGLQPRSGEACGFLVGVLIGVGLLVAGILTVSGKARDTLAGSVLSLAVGGLYLSIGIVIPLLLPPAWVGGVLSGLLGCLCLLPGVLGLIGRARYREWREETYPRPRLRFDDEEDDDEESRAASQRRSVQKRYRRRRRATDIQIDCPRCFRTLYVDVELGGMSTPCPHCQNPLDIPTPGD